MSGIYETVIKKTKKIETLLTDKLGAEGRGLHTKAESVEGILDQKIAKKIHYIATIRNNLMHEDGFEISDEVLFEKECENVIHYLSETTFKKKFSSKGFKTTDSLIKKIIIVFGKPITIFIIGFFAIFSLLSGANGQQVDVPLIRILYLSLMEGFIFSCFYWGFTSFNGVSTFLKIILFPFVMIGGVIISPFKIYQGIKKIRA